MQRKFITLESKARGGVVECDLHRRRLGCVRYIHQNAIDARDTDLIYAVDVGLGPSFQVLGQNFQSLAVATFNFNPVASVRCRGINEEVIGSLLEKCTRLRHGVGVRKKINSWCFVVCFRRFRRLFFPIFCSNICPFITRGGVDGQRLGRTIFSKAFKKLFLKETEILRWLMS